MKRTLILALVWLFVGFAAPSVTADDSMIYTDQSTTVRLFLTPCTDQKVRQFIPPEVVDEFRSGTVFWQAKEYALCYLTLFQDGMPPLIMLVDETGDSGALPLELFRPVR